MTTRLTPEQLRAITTPPARKGPRAASYTEVLAHAARTKEGAAPSTAAQDNAPPTTAPALAQTSLQGLAPSGGQKKRQGNAAEQAFHQGCDLAGVVLTRVPEPSRVVGTPSREQIRALRLHLPADPRAMPYRIARMEHAQAVDFMGHVRARRGRPLPLYAEVKSVEITSHEAALCWVPDDRLLLPKGEVGHQGRVLEQAAQDGCAALVFLVRLGGVDPGTPKNPAHRAIPSQTYLLPWPQGSPRTQTPARESWRWEELDARGWGVPVGVRWWDALSCAEAWEAYCAQGWGGLRL